MNIKKLKQNPKKLKKMDVSKLLEVFYLSNEEIKRISEQVDKAEQEAFKNDELNSWENFIETVSEIIDQKA